MAPHLSARPSLGIAVVYGLKGEVPTTVARTYAPRMRDIETIDSELGRFGARDHNLSHATFEFNRRNAFQGTCAVTALIRFETGHGESLLVEANDELLLGVDRVGRRDESGVIEASARLQDAVAQVKPAIASVLSSLRDLAPAEHGIEFGIKLTAEAGVVIAKTAVEGHFVVTMKWSKSADSLGS
jgi:hypothetical protein